MLIGCSFCVILTSCFPGNATKNRSFAGMNYLGHAFLSFGDGGILTGNMIGDHVKGRKAMEQFPDHIRKGIVLHRRIDEVSDLHSATLRAKLLFRQDYGLYAGAITDTLYDHFLANDPKYFPSQDALLAFSQQVYAQLEENAEFFPPRFAEYFPYMKQHNWLYGYRHTKGIERSLEGLARRAAYMPPVEKAYEIFISNYYMLNQCYYEFIDDIVKFAKNELTTKTI